MFAPQIVSTGLNEGCCTFTPDGRELFCHIVYRKEHDLRVSLVGAKETSDVWSELEMLEYSGGAFQDMYPFVSYDGNTLYFLSNRPTSNAEVDRKTNYWTVGKENGVWGEPELFNELPIDRGEISGLSISMNGSLYFTLITDEEQAIYRSSLENGKYSEPERLSNNVNSVKSQFDGVISPDESYMILGVYGREDSFGSTDLYITFRNEEDKWSPVVNMGEKFNSKFVDGPATITADGKYIFFSGQVESHNWGNDVLKYKDVLNHFQRPGYGSSDVYWVDAEVIEEFRPVSFQNALLRPHIGVEEIPKSTPVLADADTHVGLASFRPPGER
jgi:hypothetical protein